MAVKKKKLSIPRHFEKLGDYLRERRVEAGFTQQEVSVALGYTSAQFISNFERGIAAPPLNKIKVLTKLYRMDLAILVNLRMDAERSILNEALR